MPSSAGGTPSSESLSDRSHLSDPEFLAELDLVLTADSQGKTPLAEPATVASTDHAETVPVNLQPEQLADVAGLVQQDEARLELNGGIVTAYRRETGTADPMPESDLTGRGPNVPFSETIGHAGKDGSLPWFGALALLVVLVVGMGGVGLWQVNNIEDRLNRIEPASRVTAAPVLDSISAENSQRIGDLEQRVGRTVERMQADVEALGASLAKELERRNERLDGDLAALNTTLSALQEQLSSAQALMAEAGKKADRPTDTSVAVVAASVQPAPDPEPTAEDGVASAPSVSTAGEKTREWSVNLFAADRKDKTEQELVRVHAQDVPAEIVSVINKGKVWYRIAVRGFDSFEKASVYAETLRSRQGMSSTWVGRN